MQSKRLSHRRKSHDHTDNRCIPHGENAPGAADASCTPESEQTEKGHIHDGFMRAGEHAALIDILFLAMAVVLLMGSGIKGTGEKQNTLCFIYTDALLDDLCAIEYLSGWYDSAVILLQAPEGLTENDYASEQVRNKENLLDTASEWFSCVTEYSDTVDISSADLYLLAPLTEFAILLENNPSLEGSHALMMAGESYGADGAGAEWNAAADPEAYRYVIEHMTDMIQITAPECEALFGHNGYPFQAEFLPEYIDRMESLNDSVCCYDLQAVYAYLINLY